MRRSALTRAAQVLRGSAVCSEQIVAFAKPAACSAPAPTHSGLSQRFSASTTVGLDGKRQASVGTGIADVDLLQACSGLLQRKGNPCCRFDRSRTESRYYMLDAKLSACWLCCASTDTCYDLLPLQCR